MRLRLLAKKGWQVSDLGGSQQGQTKLLPANSGSDMTNNYLPAKEQLIGERVLWT